MKNVKFNSLKNKTITDYNICYDSNSDVLYLYTKDNVYQMGIKVEDCYLRDIVNIDHILNDKILEAYESNGFYILRTQNGTCTISWYNDDNPLLLVDLCY